MLDEKTKKELKAKLYPAADQTVFGPIKKVLDQRLHPGAKVLDAGSGKGTWFLRDYRQTIGLLVDVDIEVPKERTADTFIIGDLERLPIKDSSFDIIVCYFVIEHLRHPRMVFEEFWRVLSNAGILVFKTPCIIAPMFLLSRHIPHLWHKTIKRAIEGTEESDVFPTYYRCNTAKKIDHTLITAGFQRETLNSFEQIYDYFVFSVAAYAACLIASRLAQALPWVAPFRSQLFGVYRKP
jgi:ubiquinone/menaquinone biosynthesis C-methylase UbiE